MKTNTVKVITFISVVASIVLIIGLFWTIKDQLFYSAETSDKPIEESPLETIDKQDTLNIVAVGDSLTRGTGDSSGKGYIGYLVDQLREKSDQEVQLTNLAIRGYTSEQLVGLIEQSEIQRQIRQADILIMTIGGNDLFQRGEALIDFNKEQNNVTKSAYLKNLESTFTSIRNLNSEAIVFHVGLYNPFQNLENADVTSEVVREWNYDSAEVAAKFYKIIQVPTYDLFQLNVEAYLFNDKFHPNEKGYKLIAERVASLTVFSEEGETENE
ncbi:GDSL family lipase [Bacillus luteolus]|uniref:GDSL family lipase n=1 Tax=Litchfieldia luteola TaxID=682179 RepID=A0ABR9QGS2_9BACI|nr:GDSL-type esterase/lipase family protein [Cytobacillus luteolus]MBE4907684.1 GDSL family lipase [Cytobacillus luteolus]MBP1941135.1 lysophospholipase L1-like esterase [Cytobacillus luteolus]